ncbi:MAG: hypothetical protein ACKN9D_02765 [Actinomycetales bacterium]
MNVLLPDMTLMFPNSAVRRAIAVAAPSQYRQLDGAGLIGVLPSGTEAPAWLGQPTQADAMAVVPTQGL